MIEGPHSFWPQVGHSAVAVFYLTTLGCNEYGYLLKTTAQLGYRIKVTGDLGRDESNAFDANGAVLLMLYKARLHLGSFLVVDEMHLQPQ